MALVVAFFSVVVSGITAAATAVAGAIGSFASLAAFLTSPIGALVLGIGLQLLLAPLLMRRPEAPSVEAGRLNIRVAEPERWLAAGVARVGGGVVFAEFDAKGEFWYLVVHCDSILVNRLQYLFDDKIITINENNEVLTAEFRMRDGEIAENDGNKKTRFWVYTTTFTADNPVPPAISAFKERFPGVDGWTDDHKLAGITYSAVHVDNVDIEDRHLIYRWRGPVGLGEPAVSIVGEWSTAYNPNDGTQTLDVPSTYKFSGGNPVLIWAWFRTHRYGRNKSSSSINWARVAEQAEICDVSVIGVQGSQPRYRCGTAIPESKERNDAEQEILVSMDAQLVFDDDGKVWPRVGYYYAPTLRLTRNRDIIQMESVEAQNGESETQGVIVRYTNPDANYAAQPSAPWINPLYYIEGETPKYLTVNALTVQNHNQAMRLAKSIGLRSQAAYKILPTVGLRGLKARQERIIDLEYDNFFAGDHEIVTPVEIDPAGVFCGFGLVPITSDRFDLLPGEEKPKPVILSSENSNAIDLPTNVAINFRNGRFEATFDPPPRNDFQYIFEYQQTSENIDGIWFRFNVQMQNFFASSGGVPANQEYRFRWKTLTTGGKSSGWSSPYLTLTSTTLVVSGNPVLIAQQNIVYGPWSMGVTGGQSPYMFNDVYGRLPPGIVINQSTGEVSGTPTTTGTYSDILLRVSDLNGAFNYLTSFNITITL